MPLAVAYLTDTPEGGAGCDSDTMNAADLMPLSPSTLVPFATYTEGGGVVPTPGSSLTIVPVA